MQVTTETIVVRNCPICQEEHIYEARVNRALSMGVIDSAEKGEKPPVIFCTRLFICPKSGKTFQNRFEIQEPKSTKVTSVDVLGFTQNTDRRIDEKPLVASPHNIAIYESGKNILAESIRATTDFCKLMITLSMSAIPVFLALIANLLGKSEEIGKTHAIVTVIPSLIFLLSAVAFVIGYMPTAAFMSLDLVEEIEQQRRIFIERRIKWIKIGLTFFIMAILMGILALTTALIVKGGH